MMDFLREITQVLTIGVETISEAAEALKDYEFKASIVGQYLGHMHYAMGTPLYMMFTTAALIGIGASLWSFIIKGVNWLLDLLPMN